MRQSSSDSEVCIIGLGYVGLTLATSMAAAGFRVTGVEKNEATVRDLNKKTATFYEPGLTELLSQNLNNGRLTIGTTIPTDWQGNVFILTVGTPLNERGEIDLVPITAAVKQITAHLKEKDLVILRSTVKVGVTRKLVAAILLQHTKDCDIAFCPERTVEGQALKELPTLPQIVSGLTTRALDRAAQIFSKITPIVIRASTVETAEVIKLVDNAQRDTLFGMANEIAFACHHIGISATEVISKGKFGYPRNILPPPGPVGGPCLEKDPHILVTSALEHGYDLKIIKAARQTNESLPRHIADLISNLKTQLVNDTARPKVLIAGIAFKGKPITDDTRGTLAAPIATAIKEILPTALLTGFDPVVPQFKIKNMGLSPVDNFKHGISDTSLVVIANNHPFFTTLSLNEIAKQMRPNGLIIDLWSTYNENDFLSLENVRYLSLGNSKTTSS